MLLLLVVLLILLWLWQRPNLLPIAFAVRFVSGEQGRTTQDTLHCTVQDQRNGPKLTRLVAMQCTLCICVYGQQFLSLSLALSMSLSLSLSSGGPCGDTKRLIVFAVMSRFKWAEIGHLSLFYAYEYVHDDDDAICNWALAWCVPVWCIAMRVCALVQQTHTHTHTHRIAYMRSLSLLALVIRLFVCWHILNRCFFSIYPIVVLTHNNIRGTSMYCSLLNAIPSLNCL